MVKKGSEEDGKRIREKIDKLLAGDLPSEKTPEIIKVIDWAKRFIEGSSNNDDIMKEVDEHIKGLTNIKDPLKERERITSAIIKERKRQEKEKDKLLEEQVKAEEKARKEAQEKITIMDIFPPSELTETSTQYKTICPDCGMQGGRTEGFIIFPESNTAYCHSSGKNFRMLEAYALKKKIIRCLDGRETGESDKKILGGELYTLTLEEFKNEFGTEKYNQLSDQLNIKKTIQLPGNNRYQADFADELGDIYKSRNVLFFRSESTEVVEIQRCAKIDEEGIAYVETGFQTVNPNRFVTLAEMFIKPWTTIFTKSGGELIVNKSMNNSIATIALESPNLQKKLPLIKRIFDIQIPIMYKGILTFPKKGYDKRFGSWLPYNAPQIRTDMFTLEESKMLINKIFEEFCFESEKDRTHAIAAFITPFLRGLFTKFSTRTPVFIYMANRERAGKDYCAGCTGMLYEGANIEEPAISNDEKGASNANEEIKKKLLACMMQGKKRFHSANNKGLLNNSVFEGVTTAEVWNDRVLGKSKNLTFDNEMDYSLSGNLGIRLTPDLANRGRIINLHLIDEDANAREFKNPKLHEWILENRVAIISALYKFVENWVDKNMPKGSLPFTSFPNWAEVCGGVMEAAGYNNPCEKDVTAMISLDADTEEMKLLYECCFSTYPDKWIKKDEIENVVEGEGIMPQLNLRDNKSDQQKFGHKCEKFVNRVLSGILMTVDSMNQRASRRKYLFTKDITKMNRFTRKVDTEKNNSTGNEGQITKFIKNEISLEEFEKEKRNLEKNDILRQKGGQCGQSGYLPVLVHSSLIGNNRVMEVNSQISHIDQKTDQKLVIEKVPQEMEVSENLPKMELSDFSKIGSDYLKKEAELKNKPKKEKIKTDRELQFYESPETKDIVIVCTKEQVLDWVRAHPGVYETMYETLGNGCFKHVIDLFNENLIKKKDEGWEVVTNDV